MTREAWLRELHRRRALRRFGRREVPLLMLCAGYGTTHWCVVARHPASGAWRAYLFDGDGPVGDYGGGYGGEGYTAVLRTAAYDLGGDVARAREVTPATVDEELQALLATVRR